MGKKRKHEQSGKTSMPRDQMPLEESSDISPSSFCDVLIQFKDIIQVKVNTDEKLQKLGEKVKNIKNKSKKDLSVLKEALKKELIDEIKKALKKELIAEVREDLKKELIDEVKEELKLEIQQEMQKLEEKVESKSKEDFSVFKEDLKKELKEAKEEPDLDIQEEMQKEGCAKVHHYNASPSLRSTRFRLAIKSTVSNLVYKGKPIRTDECEGHIEVVLYDGGNPIAPDHHLASAAVQLVVVNGEFSERTQGFWSKDDFAKSIIKPRQANTRLVKDGRFILVGGRYRHQGAVITDNSNRKDFKLGVMIVGDTEERVLEGVSNPFRVQEAKTEINRVKSKESATHDAAEDLPRWTGQSFSYVTKKNGQRQQYSLPTTGQMCNFSNMQNPPQKAYVQTAGNGSPVDPLPVDRLQQQYTTQQGTTQLEHCGQGWQHSFPPKGQMCNFPVMQNQSQRTYAQTAGNGPDGHHLQQQYTTQHGTTQLEKNGICSRRQGQQGSLLPTGQMCNLPIMQNPLQRTYETTGNGLDGQLPVDHLQQQYTTQHGTTQLENYGSASTTHVNPPQHQFSQDQHMGVSESRGQNSGLGGSNHFYDRQEVYEDSGLGGSNHFYDRQEVCEDSFGEEVGCGPED